MLKKISLFILTFLSLISLTSCIKEKIEPPTKPDITIPSLNPDDDDESNSNSDSENTNNETEERVFSVSLISGGRVYMPKKGEEITVIWDSLNGEVKEAKIDEDGFARCKNLDGDYFVHLKNLPEGYTYNPNNKANWVNNDYRDLEISLYKKETDYEGNGKGLYTAYQITTTGFYTASVKKNSIVYFDFAPKEPGVYIFESLVDCYTDLVNPNAAVHKGTFANKPSTPTYLVEDGGATLKGGFTSNFKMEFKISKREIGNIFTFGISCESKNDVYPNEIDFLILNDSEYELNPRPKGIVQIAKELNKAKIKMDITGKTLYNSDGGQGSYSNTGKTNGTGLLDGTKFAYKEDEGIYYLIDKDKPIDDPTRYITPLVCFITAPSPYYDLPLISIQSSGNTSLIVRDENDVRLDYQNFIMSNDDGYCSIANKDGCTYVTKELKDFLQYFSNSNHLFRDGTGWVEFHKVFSKGNDQWLFGCGYYL